MRKVFLALLVAGVVLAVTVTAGASGFKGVISATRLHVVGHQAHADFRVARVNRFVCSASMSPLGQTTGRLTLQATVSSVMPATATTAGSLTLQVNGQPLVIPLPAGTVLPASVLANATVNLTIDLAGRRVVCPDRNDQDDNDDNDHNRGAVVQTATIASPVTGPVDDRGHGHRGDDGGGGNSGRGGGDD